MEKNGQLEQAITALIQSQAALSQSQATLVQNQAVFVGQMAEIRKDFEIIKAYLIRHEEMLGKLSEVIRQKIGFKSK